MDGQSKTTSMPMETPRDLFVHKLSDALSAERIIIGMLGDAQGMVQNPQLKQGLAKHQKESEQQARNVEQVIQMTGDAPHQVTCHAAEGLVKSLKEVNMANPSPMVLEGAVVGGAMETEHLEIATYNGLIEKAKAMGMQEAVQLLQQNLQQEENMLKELTAISQQMTQQMASMSQGQAMQQGQSMSASANG